MSDSYHYEDGAIHNDHKRVICVDKLQGADLKQLASAFFHVDAEEPEVLTINMPVYQDAHECDGKPTFFIHPSIGVDQEWQIHDEIVRLVSRQGIQEICKYLSQLSSEKKVLLPQNAEKAYNELVRLGMPDGEGYSLKTFMKHYKR